MAAFEEPVPTREDWGDLRVDLEVESGYATFGGKTVEEALPLFLDNPLECSAELRFTPPAVFNYYVFCFVALLLSPSGADESDMASTFLGLIRGRALEEPATLAPIWKRLQPAVAAVASRQAFYDADVAIYGSFEDLRADIERGMQSAEAGA